MAQRTPSAIECPLCHTRLNPEEFHALHQGSAEALEQLRRQHADELESRRRDYETRLGDLDERRKQDIEELQESRAEALKELKKQHQEALAELKSVMAESLKEQLAQMETSYTRKLQRLDLELSENREKEKRWAEERQKLKQEFEESLSKLRNEVSDREKRAAEQAKAAAAEDVRKRDQQIQELETTRSRLEKQIGDLQETARRSPSDVIGDAGEFLLKETLEAAFPGDEITKISRPGQKSGDLRQRVLIASGRFTPTVIVYDNKVGKKVTAKDLASARDYREIHRTDYVVIVTDEMPSGATDKLVIDDQGILIVKRGALTALITVLRRQVVKLDQSRATGVDRESKEGRIFDYVRGDEFQRSLRRLLALDLKEIELLQTEKRSHENMWKQRERLRTDRERTVNQVETSTSAILEQESATGQEPGTDTADLLPTPAVAKKRRGAVVELAQYH